MKFVIALGLIAFQSAFADPGGNPNNNACPGGKGKPNSKSYKACNAVCSKCSACDSRSDPGCNTVCELCSECDWWCRRRVEEDFFLEETPEPHRVLDIIESLEWKGAKADATFNIKHNLISKDSAAALVKFVDDSMTADLKCGRQLAAGQASKGIEEYEESWVSLGEGDHENEYSKKLYASDIVELIGRNETLEILNFFRETVGDFPIDCMYVVRHGTPPEGEYYIPYHIDEYLTMEVILNEDFEGGEVIHLNKDGAHKTGAYTGTAYSHGMDIAHGVAANTGGPKYMLIVKHHPYRSDKKGVVRISEAMVDELTMAKAAIHG